MIARILMAFCVLSLLGDLRAEEPAPAFANADPYDRPEHFKTGRIQAIAIYYDGEFWNIRATNRGQGRKAYFCRFCGTVELDKGQVIGDFSSFEVARRGKKRRPELSKSDFVEPLKRKRGFEFQLATAGKIDIIRFKASKNSTAVRFTLTCDGDDDPIKILIGRKGVHPESNEFVLPAFPRRVDSE